MIIRLYGFILELPLNRLTGGGQLTYLNSISCLRDIIPLCNDFSALASTITGSKASIQ